MYRAILLGILYLVLFSIGLYLIITNKDWRGYVALISTPLLHTLIKAIEKQINTKAVARQIKK
ncbi:hypothetical protein KA517_01525 [Candidatus Gracilibacteria bacterium]|nr:hypothetical protein [Candidatus Gracilibacteria bacterium]